MAVWHMHPRPNSNLGGAHIITPSNIISCSIILTNRTFLFGASPLCNVAFLNVGISKRSNEETCMRACMRGHGCLFGWGLLINSNAGYAELNWERSPVYITSSFGILRARTMHYSNLPLTLLQKRRQRHQLWFTCHSSLCSFEVKFVLNVMGMSHFKI